MPNSDIKLETLSKQSKNSFNFNFKIQNILASFINIFLALADSLEA
jgi:hypothetical protein